MRERISRTNEDQKPTYNLRRFARSVNQYPTCEEHPTTPQSPVAKTQKSFSEKLRKGGTKEFKILSNSSEGCRRSARFEKVDRKVAELSSSGKPVNGPRRSARLNGGPNCSEKKEAFDSPKRLVVEKRVTRSSVRIIKYESNEVDKAISRERARVCPREGNAKAGFDSSKESINNIEKRITRSSSRSNNIRITSSVSNDSVSVEDGIKPNGDGELSGKYISKREMTNCGVKTRVGEKRKRYQPKEERESVQGWTTEQELALQRAYFTAKPTPHFWKKVAKMVPGKSADECFNRIHSDHLTPTQPRTRSREKRKEPSPLSFSASKLLSPIEMKTKKPRNHQRALLAQKTIRKLLGKQQNKDQDYEADFFAVLEPVVVEPCCLDFPEATPPRICKEMSSPAHTKQLSRLRNTQKAAFISPPVLKQIKNKALHEKYIDQLHCRDAKRKAKSLRNNASKIDKKVIRLKETSVKVAKDALVFNAQDAISHYRNLQSSMDFNIDDGNDDDNVSRKDDDDDDDEDKLC